MIHAPGNESAAIHELLISCYFNRSIAISISVACLIFFFTAYFTQQKIKKAFVNAPWRKYNLPDVKLLMIILAAIMIIFLHSYIKKNTEYIDDIAQITENRLSIAKAYAPSFIPSDRGKSWLEVIVFGEGKTRFLIPHGLEFDIEETDLTETHSDTETKTGGGTLMTNYIISYTDNTKTVFSIQNVILAEQENYYAAALESDARGDYEQAYKYLIQAPDISGAMCLQGKYLILGFVDIEDEDEDTQKQNGRDLFIEAAMRKYTADDIDDEFIIQVLGITYANCLETSLRDYKIADDLFSRLIATGNNIAKANLGTMYLSAMWNGSVTGRLNDSFIKGVTLMREAAYAGVDFASYNLGVYNSFATVVSSGQNKLLKMDMSAESYKHNTTTWEKSVDSLGIMMLDLYFYYGY
jgi:hypothetical protein